jgi:hypothetical protein
MVWITASESPGAGAASQVRARPGTGRACRRRADAVRLLEAVGSGVCHGQMLSKWRFSHAPSVAPDELSKNIFFLLLLQNLNA